jgi:glycosyltransferase involved in cell wall biosynthesis
MRILIAADSWFPDVRGGSARVAAETARRFSARGHETTALAPAGGNAPVVETGEGLTVLRRLHRSALPHTLSDTFSAWQWARRVNGAFDLLLGHQPTVSAGLGFARSDLPLVFVYHASAVRENRLRAEDLPLGPAQVSSRALAAFLAGLEDIAMHRARRVLVLSNYSRSLVLRDHPEVAERVVVVSGGVDINKFSPAPGRGIARATLGVREDERLLVSMRRLEPQLGLETVIHAFHRLTPSRKTRLVVVGEGTLAPRLQALAAKLGLGGRVQLAPSHGEEELRQWYRAADLFVLPPAQHEGFGLATIEALASGTPAVAAPVGASPEVLAPLDRRLLARSSEPGDLASAIAGALEMAGPELRRRCREYATTRFAWDRVIRAWENALLDATQPRGKGSPPRRRPGTVGQAANHRPS